MGPKAKSSPARLRSAPPAQEPEIELGSISGVFGLRGEVRLFLHHRESTWLHGGRKVILIAPDGGRWEASLQARPGAGRRVVARVEGISNPEQAEGLRDWRILVPRSALPEPARDEFYVSDVVGQPATVEGEAVGTVVALHTTGPVHVLEVRLEGGGLAYVPCLRENLRSIGPAGVDLAPEALVREDEG